MPTVAVLIPCYNEEVTIAKVVDDFRRALPDADIYVYDNNSTDDTARLARLHGATVVREPRQGKGNVVRQMLRDIDADCYLMVDGDDNYPAESAHDLIAPILAGTADHVIGDRLSNGTYSDQNKRIGHAFGNDLVCWLIKHLYGYEFNDVMTGYRAFNRPYAKTLPILSPGFEIETEMSIQTIDKNWRIEQVPIAYRGRPEGSESKLNTVSDGIKVLLAIASLTRDYQPLRYYGCVALALAIACAACGVPALRELSATHGASGIAMAVVSGVLFLLTLFALGCGLVLDSIVKENRRKWEVEVMDVYGQHADAQ